MQDTIDGTIEACGGDAIKEELEDIVDSIKGKQLLTIQTFKNIRNMDILNLALIIVLIIVSIIGCIWTLANGEFLLSLPCFIILVLSDMYMARESDKLNDKDVFNGEAEYVETIYISNGDTIKTYHIQPKESK